MSRIRIAGVLALFTVAAGCNVEVIEPPEAAREVETAEWALTQADDAGTAGPMACPGKPGRPACPECSARRLIDGRYAVTVHPGWIDNVYLTGPGNPVGIHVWPGQAWPTITTARGLKEVTVPSPVTLAASSSNTKASGPAEVQMVLRSEDVVWRGDPEPPPPPPPPPPREEECWRGGIRAICNELP